MDHPLPYNLFSPVRQAVHAAVHYVVQTPFSLHKVLKIRHKFDHAPSSLLGLLDDQKNLHLQTNDTFSNLTFPNQLLYFITFTTGGVMDDGSYLSTILLQ